MHTTNYKSTFIEIAEDSFVRKAEIPPDRSADISADKSVARLQYELISAHPYEYTSDDVLFMVHALRNQTSPDAQAQERKAFFSKKQPCLRSSPLSKRYGWGIHSDAEARVALYGVESPEYEAFISDPSLTHKKALQTGK
jgi:hypothetical protein